VGKLGVLVRCLSRRACTGRDLTGFCTTRFCAFGLGALERHARLAVRRAAWASLFLAHAAAGPWTEALARSGVEAAAELAEAVVRAAQETIVTVVSAAHRIGLSEGG
jgi:hypothetical protein